MVNSNMILDAILNAMAIIMMAYRIMCDDFMDVTWELSISFARSMLYTKFTPTKMQSPMISVEGTEPKGRLDGRRIK
jgi:hypothetical protein